MIINSYANGSGSRLGRLHHRRALWISGGYFM